MYVIGTAGHIDHGKSVLVEALTGIDPDRLREEKERGMTIDLGFAWLTLPSGREVSLVDVPGHERFIKNMLAGVGGVDMALLVVAANEGVMPQTREHLAILDLLAVGRGVIAVTKSDLVEPEFLELVAADVQEAVAGTSLAGAPLVAVSAKTGDGLDELGRVLDEQLAETPPKRDMGRPRLPVDRSFTVAGFGTVVTGTLIDGSLEVGQEVAVLPGDLTARIRGLQHHREHVERAGPGRRTAVNLSGIAKDDVRRGQVLALPGTLTPTAAIDVRVRATEALRRPLRHGAELALHTGSAEVTGRLLLLDRQELAAGDRGWAQLRLASPVAVVKGDRFVLRTPNDTVGGGEIVDVHPRRHRRLHEPTLAALEALVAESPADTLLAALESLEPASLTGIANAAGRSLDETTQLVTTLVSEGRAVSLGGEADSGGSLLMTAAGFASLGARAVVEVSRFHLDRPLRRGMPREELRSKLALNERLFAAALERWVAHGTLAESAALVALAGREPAPSPEQQAAAEAYVAALAAKPFAPPAGGAPDADLLAYLEEDGQVVAAGQGIVFTRAAYDEMVGRVTEHLRTEGTITLAQVRDMFDTSRKYAQALLEHMDESRITRRVGDERVLRDRIEEQG